MMISTIMVCRNAEATIGGAVETFLAQDHPDKELVVVDGASTDRTVEIVEAFASPDIRLHSEPDKGIYDAMNKGLARFRGDAFGFLNADDRYHGSGALSRIAEALETADMISGDLNFVNVHDGSAPVRVWRASPFRPGAFRRGWAPAHPTTYARRSVYDRVGQFDASFRIAGDYDWLMRALEIERFSYEIENQTLVDMAIGGISTAGWSAKVANARELLRARQLRLGSGPVDLAIILGPLRKLPQLRGHRIPPVS